LGVNSVAEQEKVDAIIDDEIPYQFAYCGGEVFPQWLSDGKIQNNLQNVTIIICVL
jgi:hypothetical protein